MKLSDYLEVNNISVTTFSRACNIPPTTLISYLRNISEPGVTNALKIINATIGAVKLLDLKIEK